MCAVAVAWLGRKVFTRLENGRPLSHVAGTTTHYPRGFAVGSHYYFSVLVMEY